MKPRKRLAFGLRTYSNLNARRARARIDNRIFDAEMAGEGGYYTVSPRIKMLVRQVEDAMDRAYEQAAEDAFDEWGDFDPETDRLDDEDYCWGCGNIVSCCECD